MPNIALNKLSTLQNNAFSVNELFIKFIQKISPPTNFYKHI